MSEPTVHPVATATVRTSLRGRPRVGGLTARIALAGGSGLLTDAAFPGTGWWWLAPVGVAGLVLVVRGPRPLEALLLGFVFGMAFLAPHLRWTGTYVGPGPWLALAVLEATFLAPVAAVLSLGWRSRWPRFAVVMGTGAIWVLMEAIRGRVPFGGFPWARLGFSQPDSLVSVLAPIGGVPLMSWAVASAGAVLACGASAAAHALGGAPSEGPGLIRRMGVPVALVVAASVAMLPRPETTVDVATVARVAIVQGDVPDIALGRDAERRGVLDNHVRLTKELGRRELGLDAVIWPENSSDIDPLRDDGAAASIQEAVDAVDAPVLVGAVLVQDDDTLRNASIVWQPRSSGTPGPQDTYIKRRVVPFGEYIPLRPLVRAITDKADLVPRDFVGGRDDSPVQLGPMSTAVGICFEVAFDDLLRSSVARGADVLVIPTNNATFGRTDQSLQQLAMSRVRAMEFGMTVVQASTTGVSAVAGPDGRLVEGPTALYEPGVLVADVVAAPRTLATTLGGWIELGLTLWGAVSVLCMSRWRAAFGRTSGPSAV